MKSGPENTEYILSISSEKAVVMRLIMVYFSVKTQQKVILTLTEYGFRQYFGGFLVGNLVSNRLVSKNIYMEGGKLETVTQPNLL